MSCETKMVVLRNGYQVPSEKYNYIVKIAEYLVYNNNMPPMLSLIKKCHATCFRLIPNQNANAEAFLHHYHLLDDNGDVREDVRRIVLSSIDMTETSLRIYVPVKKEIYLIKVDENKKIAS